MNGLKEADFILYAVSTVMALSGCIVFAAKDRLHIKNTPINHSFVSLVRFFFISRYYSLFLPSAFGAEFVRWYKVTQNKKGRNLFFTAVVFDRLGFIFVVLLFCLIPLLLFASTPEIVNLRSKIWPFILLFILLTSLAISCFVFPCVQSCIRYILTYLFRFHRKGQNVIGFFEKYALSNTSFYYLVAIFILNILWHLFFLFRIFILFRALDVTLMFHDVTWMCSLSLLIQLIPISFAGIGVREGTYGYLLSKFSLPLEKGVLVGVLSLSQLLLLSIIGGVLEFWGIDSDV